MLARATILASLCSSLLLSGCASSPDQGGEPERVLLADVDDEGEADGDLTGFPTAPGLLPRDYLMKEQAGPLKGFRLAAIAGRQ